jgi:transcriptional regulator with XRE-family HTH domain
LAAERRLQMLLRNAIGFVLRRLRQEQGKTLRELADEARISLPYLSEIERGRKEASSEILSAICQVLDITEQELLLEVADEYELSRAVVSIRGTEQLLVAA